MANSLMEAIQSNMQKPVQPQAGSTLSQTKQISDILGTKATGKIQPIEQGLPLQSNIGEQAAQAETMAQSRQQAIVGSQAASQLGVAAEQQTKDIDYATRELDQRQIEASNRLLNQSSKVLDSYSNGLRELDYSRDKARLEQVGFSLRLSNDQYIDRLQREAAKARLDDALNFKEALQASIFQDEESLFNNNLEFRKLLNADDREFANRIANMDINSAIAIANAQTQQANMQAKYSGISSMMQAGIAGVKAYADYSEDSWGKGPEDLPDYMQTSPKGYERGGA